MTVQEYGKFPEHIFVRHLRYQVTQPGFRTRTIVIATTLLHAVAYTVEDIADLFRQRWQVEVDIRSLKTHMRMEHLRCHSPEMVRKEIYCNLLAYNLVRKAIVESAIVFNKLPRHLSFKGAVQALNAFMSAMAARGPHIEEHYQCLLLTISEQEIGDRPNRIEPRRIKRRPKSYGYLNERRSVARKRVA